MPHGNGKDDVPRENQRLDAHLGQDSYNERRKSHDDECSRSKNEPCICRGVAVQALEHLRNQHRRPEQNKAKKEIVNVRDGKVPVCEQTNFYHGVGMAPLPKRGGNQRHESNREEENNKTAFEPVFGLSAIQNDLQTREAQGHQNNPETINPKPAAFPGRFDFTCELWRVGNESARQDQRHDSDGNVDKEDPPPTPVVCDPPTERRADRRGSYDGHAVESESRGPLLRRERVHKNGLLDRRKPSAPDTLQDAKENEQGQGRSET